MPRVSSSNGIKPEIRALAVIKMGVPVTPQEINDHVGTGDYASKYISFLKNRYGFSFTIQKDENKKVVSYTLTGEPKNVDELRNMKPKEKAPKAEKKEPMRKSARKVNRKFNQMPNHKKTVNKRDPEAEKLLEELGMKPGEIGNYMVDPSWDSYDGLNVRELII